MFRGIVIWTIWIERIDLVFNNARWDYFNVQGTIWEALINYGKAKWDKCSIKFSLTKGMKIDLANVICAKFDKFVEWHHDVPCRGFIN